MVDTQWDEQLKQFLKRTGEDFKRAGADIRAEAQRLVKEVQDPERQAKMKEGLRELGSMARKAAEEVATAVETGVRKAEDAFKPKGSPATTDEVQGAPTPPSPPPADMAAAPKPAPKSIGGKRKKAAKAKSAAAPKSLGRKRK